MLAFRSIARASATTFNASSRAFSRVTGTTKFFDSVKGFGFIAPSDGSPDVFVHQSNIKTTGFRSLGEGEEVEYEVETNQETGKRFAVAVTGPDGAPPKGAPKRAPGGRDGGDRERRPRRSGSGGDSYERF